MDGWMDGSFLLLEHEVYDNYLTPTKLLEKGGDWLWKSWNRIVSYLMRRRKQRD